MTFYFTFGFLSPHSGKYTKVYAPCWSEADRIMRDRYDSYQYQYTEQDFWESCHCYDLELLDTLGGE